MKKNKNYILKSITNLMLVVNAVSVSHFMMIQSDEVSHKILCIIGWVVSELWLITFAYANMFYVPKNNRKPKKRIWHNYDLRKAADIVGLFVGIFLAVYFTYRSIIDFAPYGGIDLLIMIYGLLIIAAYIDKYAGTALESIVDRITL